MPPPGNPSHSHITMATPCQVSAAGPCQIRALWCVLFAAEVMSAVFHPHFYEATGAPFLSAQAA